MTQRSLTYVEIDIDFCALTYGIAPCQAVLGTTGEIKCFNSLVTCQDRPNFTNEPVTLRFAISTDYLPEDIEAIPSVMSAEISPGSVSLGENLGLRATLNVTFKDHKWSDTGQGFDKYVTERDYDPFEQGTFWPKFRARQPFLQGRPIRLIRGFLGQTLSEMETRHYIIESFDGPDPQGGTYKLIGKDVLKLADGDRAKAPVLSNGFLVADITATDTTATLSPAGVGDAEYPLSGIVAIGGKEIVDFTRVGDVLTLTARGQRGTESQDHDAQERVQLVLTYTAQDPADIIADLLQTYANVPSEFIPISSWRNETDNFFGRLLTATIPEPTDVKKLVSEIIEQAALAVWWADDTQQIRLQVLRGIPTTAARFTPENVLEGSLKTKEQPNRRLTQVWTYYAQRNPLERLTDPDNFGSTEATVDLQAEADYGQPVIKTIFSRWIPAGGRSIASRLNDIQLGRFRDPPRKFKLACLRSSELGAERIELGAGYRLEAYSIQDATGAQTDAPIQVTRLKPSADRFEAEAQEMLFQGPELDPNDRTIILDFNQFNINLRAVYDTLFAAPVAGDEVRCIIEPGVIIGSASTAMPAFDVGDWPAGVAITLDLQGRIQGHGGGGGNGGLIESDEGEPAQDGFAGGAALKVSVPLDLEIATGELFGGGGGGGGAATDVLSEAAGGGGGGGGTLPGSGGLSLPIGEANGQPGTLETGGTGGQPPLGGDVFVPGGDGGGPGLPGQPGAIETGTPAQGGAAGAAIDGVSFVTITAGPGDIRGPQIN